MPKKEITIREFIDDLEKRIKEGKTIDCCRDDLLRLTEIAKEKLGKEKIVVNWVD